MPVTDDIGMVTFEIFVTDLSRFEVKREDHRKEVNETSNQVNEQLKD